jgi:hypothetical protein
MDVQCFPGIRNEHLKSAVENRELGNADTLIHVDTNDLRRNENLDYVMGEVYDLVNTAKTKFPKSILILSGVLRRQDVSWRRIGAQNDRSVWAANTLGAISLDPNSCTESWDFGKGGLHINQSGARWLSHLYS